MTEPPKNLWQLLGQANLSDFLGWDLVVGVCAGAVGAWAAVEHFTQVKSTASSATNVLAAVIGAVVAAVGLIAAFLNSDFLRKLTLLKREPTKYLTPFLSTVLLGVLAAAALLVFGALTPTAAAWVRGLVGGVAIGLTAWTLGSLLRCLSTLIQFVQLQVAASEVDLDVPRIPKTKGDEAHG